MTSPLLQTLALQRAPRLFTGLTLVLGLLFTVLPSPVSAKSSIKAKDYVTGGQFTEDDLVEFIIDYFDIPLVELRPGTKQAPTAASKRKHPTVVTYLRQVRLNSSSGKPPYTIADIEKALPPNKSEFTQYQELPDWRKIKGITEPGFRQETDYAAKNGGPDVRRVISGDLGEVLQQKEALKSDPAIDATDAPKRLSESSFGPFQLRRSVGTTLDYNVEAFKWSAWLNTESSFEKEADLLAIQGAKVGYSDNRLLDGGGAWSSEGALIYPFHHLSWHDDGPDRFYHAGLAVSWKLEEQEKPGAADIDELKLSAPLGVGLDFTAGQFFMQAEPYYQTDTDFDGGIIGATTSFEFVGHDLWGTYFLIKQMGKNRLSGRLRAIGLVDYSDVRETSPYIKRTLDDDWFRVGGLVSFDVGLFPEGGKQPPITLGVSYRFLQEVGDDNGGYSDLFKANATLWLSPHAGVTLEYQKGETPIADKDIDIITLGLEIKL